MPNGVQMNNNDHYVPQFILRQFHNEDDRLNVFDKWEAREFVTSTRNVASEKGFYDLPATDTIVPFEPVLCDVENNALGPITAVIENRTLSTLEESDRNHVAYFLAMQMMRTRASRDLLSQMMEGFRNVLPQKHIEESQLPEGFLFTDEDELKSLSIFNLSIANEIFPHLIDKIWCLNSPDGDETFLISDHPFVKRNMFPDQVRSNGGIGSPGIQVYMPLAPQLILSLLCPTLLEPFHQIRSNNPNAVVPFLDSIENGTPIEIPPESVAYCNSLQIAHSTRFLFSCNNGFSLAREMITNNPELRKPQHVAVR